MNTVNAKTESQKQVSMLQMARLRVEIAESRWEEAKEQARAARRKRKEVKAIARSAKKQAKEAKAELAEAQSFLAEVEAKLAGAPLAAPKARKGRPVSSAPPAASDSTAPSPPDLDSESKASPVSVPPETIVGSPPEEVTRGGFGNWR